jgi:CheY-like chemotaxis protein
VPFHGVDVSQFVPALRDRSGGQIMPVVLVSLDASLQGPRKSACALPVVDWVRNEADLARLPEIVRALARNSYPDQPRILHVEDDPDVLDVVRHALETDFTIVSAPTLAIARQQLAEEEAFKLVILDLTLSDGLGKDLIPALVDAAGRPIPTIVFTAQDGTPELAAQVEAVLTKSRGNLTTLVEAVRSVITSPVQPGNLGEDTSDEQPQSALRG